MEAITWQDFEKIDIRVGTIIEANEFPKAKKPAYQLTIDFGELGIKKSSAQITHFYSAESLAGQQVIAVVNFPPKKIADFTSECLVLGIYDENKNVVLLQPQQKVANGLKDRMNLYTAYYKSPIGVLKIQCSDKYVKTITFSDAEGEIENDEHKLLTTASKQLDEYFAGKRKTFNLPLNQDGTDFQEKVWDLLYKIPYGKTISYNELSKRHGDLKAIRAVASANGKNNICIIVPCHRVIGSNQSLVGYAGGLWRKKWLLDHEAKYHSGVQQFDFGPPSDLPPMDEDQ